ncbi:MAG: efflux RND transporter periplasmic adaptor subunit [Polyangiaceae bacterium]|nr:efflux RND transporter periplasmic adaptor subunit [Polyangiaceae bacterium]
MTDLPEQDKPQDTALTEAPEAPPSPAPPATKHRRWVAQLKGLLRHWTIALAIGVAFGLGIWLSPGPAEDHPANAAAAEKGGATSWRCSMHPQIQLPEPGACPICGMDLITLASGFGDERSDERVSISENAAKLSGIRTVKAYRAETTGELRLLGRLEYDETAVRTVTSWISGRLDRLYVSTLGASIGAGQIIAKVYSPEVYAAHQDLILARKQVARMSESLPVARGAADAAQGSARQRLKLLGLEEEEVTKMEQEDTPRQHVLIRSPFGGAVLEQMVHQGAYVSTGSPMYRVAALGRIWVQLDAYETDLARIDLGDVVTIEAASYPDERFEGKVTFIDPVLDPASRTAKVRIEVPNKKGRLRPGMFAEAVVHASGGDRQSQAPLVVPSTAVLLTGERAVVYVAVSDQERLTYEVREVRLGTRAGNVFPVVSGLREGEQVVVEGAFVLDAELQIRGGNSMMTMPDDLAREKYRPFKLSANELGKLEPLVRAYLDVQVALAKDRFEEAKRAALATRRYAALVVIAAPLPAARRWKELQQHLGHQAQALRDAKNLKEARGAFEELSVLVIEVVRRYGNPLGRDVRLAFCPMAMENRGAEWLQEADSVHNPYLGSEMSSCGELRSTAEPKGRLPQAEMAGPAGVPAGHQH